MINSIYLKDFLLIKEQTINFTDKTNAIFGETGSGKSILFKAFMQLSGQKADSSLVREGCENYYIEATFENNDKIIELLNDNDLDVSENLVISRKTSNKSTIRINGEIVTLKVLQQFGKQLFDFTNQHEVSQFTNSSYILSLVSDNIDLSKYLNIYNEYVEVLSKLNKLSDKKLNKDEQLEIVKYRLKQLSKIEMFENYTQYEDYLNEFENLKQLKQNSDSYNELLNYMSTGVSNLNKIDNIVSNLEADDLLEDLINQIELLNNLDYELNKKYSLNFDEHEYEKMSVNINNFKTLMRTYKMNEEEILNYKDQLEIQIEELESVDIDYKNTQNKLTQITELLEIEALEISKTRTKNSEYLTKKIENLLNDLQMSHVNIKFEFTKNDYSKTGFDKVELLVSTNNQSILQPIDKVASGGELSRILLAIKSVSNKNNDLTIFFDEIDSGVSGVIASLMAKILMKLSETTQIIFISHLPQMLCISSNFLYVDKTINENNAISTIKSVKNDELIDNLAYFIDNEKPSEESKNLIVKMLKEVHNENISN